MLAVAICSAVFARRSSLAARASARMALLSYERGRPRMRIRVDVVAMGCGTTITDSFATRIYPHAQYALQVNWYNESQYAFHCSSAWLRVEALSCDLEKGTLTKLSGYRQRLWTLVPNEVKPFEGGSASLPLESLPGNIREAALAHRLTFAIYAEPASFSQPASTMPHMHAERPRRGLIQRAWEWEHLEIHQSLTSRDPIENGAPLNSVSPSRRFAERLERAIRFAPRANIEYRNYRTFPVEEKGDTR